MQRPKFMSNTIATRVNADLPLPTFIHLGANRFNVQSQPQLAMTPSSNKLHAQPTTNSVWRSCIARSGGRPNAAFVDHLPSKSEPNEKQQGGNVGCGNERAQHKRVEPIGNQLTLDKSYHNLLLPTNPPGGDSIALCVQRIRAPTNQSRRYPQRAPAHPLGWM